MVNTLMMGAGCIGIIPAKQGRIQCSVGDINTHTCGAVVVLGAIVIVVAQWVAYYVVVWCSEYTARILPDHQRLPTASVLVL